MPSQISLKLYSKLCSHSNHLIGGLCRFLALVQTVPEKSETLSVPKVILIISTAVLGTSPTGLGLKPFVKSISSNSKASSTEGLVSGGNHCCSMDFGFKMSPCPISSLFCLKQV